MGMTFKLILVIAVVLAITAAIMAIAPYLAIIIVIAVVGWYYDRTSKEEEKRMMMMFFTRRNGSCCLNSLSLSVLRITRLNMYLINAERSVTREKKALNGSTRRFLIL